MLIYISFSAQDNNTAVGWDMTLSMPSWTRWEDPVTTTWRRCFSLNYRELWSICRIYLYCAYFGASPSGEAAKTGSSKKITISGEAPKQAVVKQLLYSLVSRWIYGSRVSRGVAPGPHIFISYHASAPGPRCSTFIDDMEPMNVALYIRRWHITDECILYLSVPMNMLGYVHWPYIRWRLRQLTDEFTLYSSV
jgi:hypothetical protein